jgi:NAD(P)-dependent dehydrogenase (short-subunit alcohol dehydrogenase family)
MTPVSSQASTNCSGQVVVVTGAGTGIGSEIAIRFAEAGANVVVHYHTSSSSAQSVVSRIQALGREGILLQANLTRSEEVDRLFAETVTKLGKVDVLINSAGIYPHVPLLEITPEDWHQVLDANLTTVFLCTQAASRRMITQGSGGVIVSIASIEAENPTPGHAHYCAAKAAVVMFTRTAARELGQYGIRVNAVSPGVVWREGIEKAWPDGVSRWLRTVPLGRLGQATDVADACMFLASPSARWITGTNLLVDGGIMTCQVY